MWKIIRHSGRKNDKWDIRHEGAKDQIIDKYCELGEQIKRGGVGLVNAWAHSQIIGSHKFYTSC